MKRIALRGLEEMIKTISCFTVVLCAALYCTKLNRLRIWRGRPRGRYSAVANDSI